MQKNTTQENSSLEQRFIQTVIEWQHLVTTIQLLAFEVKDTLSTDFTEEQNYEMQARLKALEDAFAFLQEQASHPELTLATTGTTSSGKSTLANFLVGERILPSAVQEMSAGLVKIIHSDKRRLVVKRVDQITQEEKIIHTQENPTAKDINDHLESQMNAFRVEEESGKEVEAILFEITWPIRLAERKKELGLPEGTQVTILDLPGLKAVNDERNGPVIRANIAKAFCLVAYNAEETDRTKQKTLLNEVVNQVMALSYGNSKDEEQEEQKESHTKGSVSSLQRMLFLLNRVDAFYRHDDASKQLEKFKGEVTTQLRGKLEEALPNHKKTIKKATHDLAQICSLPALLAVEADLLWKAPEKQAEVLKRFDKEFGNIFPKDYFDEFPRKIKDIEQLKEEQKKDLIQKALECSYGEAFEKRLSSHITETFFEIVFDVPLRNLSETSGHLVQMLDTLVERYKARTEQEAQEAQLRLREIDDKLSNEIQKISEICRCVITITKDTSEKMEARLGGGKKTL